MASKSSARFTLMIDGKERRLFSVGESKNGDVYIIPRTGGTYRDPGILDPSSRSEHDGSDILEVRYSIHPSPNSAEGVSVIRQKFTTSTGYPDGVRLFTKALKDRSGFVPIFFWRPSSMGGSSRDIDARQTICLDTYDPKMFTPVIGFLIGHASLAFKQTSRDFKIFEYKIRDYKLVVLISYFICPQHDRGLFENRGSIDPKIFETDDLREVLEGQFKGRTVEDCIFEYQLARNNLRDEAMIIARNIVGEHDTGTIPFESFGFFKRGRKNTTEYMKKLREVIGG